MEQTYTQPTCEFLKGEPETAETHTAYSIHTYGVKHD